MFRSLLALVLLAVPCAAHAEWYEASSAHFIVYSDEKPERLKQFATELERFDKAMRVLRNLPDAPAGPASRVTVFVVDDRADMARLFGNYSIAGLYRARASESVAFVPRRSGSGSSLDLKPQQILLHEYAHHFMYSMAPDSAYPLWFVEAWAELHATARFDPDGSVGFGAPPQYRAEQLMHGDRLRAERMLTARPRSLSGTEFSALYGRGWLLLHYLTFGGAREGQLKAYMAAINAGRNATEAAKVFGDLDVLDRELGRYKLGAIRGVTVNASALPIGEVRLRPLTAGEAATMEVRMVTTRGVDDGEAPKLYEQAKRAAARYPDDAAAQRVLAEAAFDAKDYAGAEAAADRAIAADPRLIEAYLFKARARMEIAVKAGDRSKESWVAIRKTIAIANRLDPDDPEPLMVYFESYPKAGEAPTRVARQGLYRAFALAPQDATLRVNAARSWLEEGQAEHAAILLRPLAFSPHGGDRAERIARVLAAVDAGGAAAGLAEFRKIDEEIKAKDARKP